MSDDDAAGATAFGSAALVSSFGADLAGCSSFFCDARVSFSACDFDLEAGFALSPDFSFSGVAGRAETPLCLATVTLPSPLV